MDSDVVDQDYSISKHNEVMHLSKRFDQVSLCSFNKVISKEVVLGISHLLSKKGAVCGDYQVWKQIKVAPKKLFQLPTDCALKLLHMNLLGPILIESIVDLCASKWILNELSCQQNGVMASKHSLPHEMTLDLM